MAAKEGGASQCLDREYSLPPLGCDGYIWIKSKSHRSLEDAAKALEDVIAQAKRCSDCNLNLISMSEKVLSQTCADLVLVEEKDRDDREAAFAMAEKAARKLLKKQKSKGK